MSSRRTKAREITLQMLYQLDLNPDVPGQTVLEQVQERLTDEPSAKFGWQLYVGVLENRKELDSRIEAIAANWSLKRMAPTDRNVLRLGAFELLFTETPPRVVIDEALELAKRFGSSQSAQFVNGILDRLIPPGRVDRVGVEPELTMDPARTGPGVETEPARESEEARTPDRDSSAESGRTTDPAS